MVKHIWTAALVVSVSLWAIAARAQAAPPLRFGADPASGSPAATKTGTLATGGNPAASADGADTSSNVRESDNADTFFERLNRFEELASSLQSACGEQSLRSVEEEVNRPRSPTGANEGPGTAARATRAPRADAVRRLRDDVCARFCTIKAAAGSKDANTLDVCAFADREKATVAVLADWESVVAVVKFIDAHMEAARDSQEPRMQLLARNVDAMKQRLESGALGGLGGVFSAEAIASFASGLARFIVDRAKREGIGWFLGEMHSKLCGAENAPTQAQREVRAYWFPKLCALAASKQEFAGYGAGGRLFEALRAAIVADLRDWPASTGGLALGAAFWAASSQTSSLFECNTAQEGSKADACRSLTSLRSAGAEFVDGVLRGRSATAEALKLGTSMNAANRKPPGVALYSDGFQLAACAMSLSGAFDAHATAIQSASLSELAEGRAHVFAGLVTAPACWTIFGRGIRIGDCDAFGGKATKCAEQDALAGTAALERLSTVLRLYDKLGARADVVGAQWKALKQALVEYRKAVAASSTPAPLVAPSAPTISLELSDLENVDAVLRALDERSAKALRDLEQSGVIRHLRAALGVARAAAAVSTSTIELSAGVVDESIYPGFTRFDPQRIQAVLQDARTANAAILENLELIDGILAQDWGAVGVGVLANVRLALRPLATSERDSKDIIGRLNRYLGLVVAIAGERDPEKIAEAIESAADPVGGWAHKGKSGARTLSLMSHAGVFGGAEWRYGKAGTKTPGLDDAHPVMPTLVLPVGLEYALGFDAALTSPFGLFASLIDPAGFLQYDAENDAALPPPRVNAILAPGFAFRFGIQGTPFSLLPSVFYRPGLRAENSDRDAPAANALQFGLSASVDVTILELWRGE